MLLGFEYAGIVTKQTILPAAEIAGEGLWSPKTSAPAKTNPLFKNLMFCLKIKLEEASNTRPGNERAKRLILFEEM